MGRASNITNVLVIVVSRGKFTNALRNYCNSTDHGSTSRFDPDAFYLLLLPPIIFNTGLEINADAFYRNFFAIGLCKYWDSNIVGILMYSFGTTEYSVGLTKSESYTFGALLSATDPVTTIAVFERLQVEPNLYTGM